MKTFLITCAAKKLPDTAKAIGLEYLPASWTPHPETGKVDPHFAHLRVSPMHDAFLALLDEGPPELWLCYADSTDLTTADVLKAAIVKAAHKDLGAPRDVAEFLAIAPAMLVNKIAPVPEGKSERVLAVCAAGDDPEALCKPEPKEPAEPKVVEKVEEPK